MGQNNSTNFANKDRKTIEFEIFDKSFVLIERYIKNNTKGLRNSFQREYAIANNSRENGYLNWRNVMPSHLKPGPGMGYGEAIKTTGQLLRKARDSSNRSDKQSFAEIYALVDSLISQRKEELNPRLAVPIFGWVIWGGDQYDNHNHVVSAWKAFKR